MPAIAHSDNLSGDGKDTSDKKTGIVANHYYTVMACKDIQYKNSESLKLVKLRNPWGTGEWKGAFSDFDPVWSDKPKLAAALGWTMKDNGKFWLPYEDFCKYFKSYQVCQFQDGFEVSSFKLRLAKSKQYWFKFEIKSEGKYSFMLHQLDHMMFPRTKQKVYGYSDVT